MPVIQNKKGSKVVVKTLVSETLALSALQSPGETIAGVGIAQVYWSGTWNVLRGGNVVLTLTGNDNWIFDGVTAINEDSTANLVMTLVSGTGTLMLELDKKFAADGAVG